MMKFETDWKPWRFLGWGEKSPSIFFEQKRSFKKWGDLMVRNMNPSPRRATVGILQILQKDP